MKAELRITLGGDMAGLHAKPCSILANALKKVAGKVSLARDGKECAIDMELPATSLLQAAADLDLRRGAQFSLTCKGNDPNSAIRCLKEAFESDCFKGTLVEEVIA